MTTAKNPAFIGLYLGSIFGGGDKIWWWESTRGNEQIFSWAGTPPHSPPVRKTLNSWGWGVEIGISRGITEIACEISSD